MTVCMCVCMVPYRGVQSHPGFMLQSHRDPDQGKVVTSLLSLSINMITCFWHRCISAVYPYELCTEERATAIFT